MNVKIFGEGFDRVGVREITSGIYWITHCLGDYAGDYYAEFFSLLPNPVDYVTNRIVDYPFSAFLILDEKSLLIDTGAPAQRENTLRALDSVLGGKSLDYIWISHVELPHAGNAAAIQRKYPSAKIVAVSGGDHYALHGLEHAMLASAGEIINLGKRSVEMVEPLFMDHGLSQWLYERETGFFFSADWGHNLHEPSRSQCFQFVDEMENSGYTEELFIDDVAVNAWYQFPWLAWTDPDEIAAAVDRLFKQYDVRIFAPSHGNLIREDVARYAPLLQEGTRKAVLMPLVLHTELDQALPRTQTPVSSTGVIVWIAAVSLRAISDVPGRLRLRAGSRSGLQPARRQLAASLP